MMKIDEFVKNILVDIDNGINEAQKITHKNYCVKDTKGGVTFDIAVTVINNVIGNLTAGGKAETNTGTSIIQVVAGNVGAEGHIEGNIEGKTSNSEISRITFSIRLPTDTIEKENTKEEEKQAVAREAAVKSSNVTSI